jgi:hypothetical protein
LEDRRVDSSRASRRWRSPFYFEAHIKNNMSEPSSTPPSESKPSGKSLIQKIGERKAMLVRDQQRWQGSEQRGWRAGRDRGWDGRAYKREEQARESMRRSSWRENNYKEEDPQSLEFSSFWEFILFVLYLLWRITLFGLRIILWVLVPLAIAAAVLAAVLHFGFHL